MTTVADVLADGLVRAGTARVFSVAGDHDVELVIAAVERTGLPVVPVSRPDVACVMAAISGTIDGTPGAALIGGELGGAAAGLAYASLDRAPAIVISSEVPIDASGAEATTKAVLTVTPESAAHWIAHACQLAMREPWGPVRLDVSPGVAASAALLIATSCRPAPLPAPEPLALGAAVDLLEHAERPVVVVGRWCRSESDAVWVRAFAEARPAPVLATPRARGVVPDPHPLLIGILDAGGPERTLLASADLIVTIGVDPDEMSSGLWPARTKRLELTPVAPEAADRVVVSGDIGAILEELAPRLRDRRSAEWDVARLHALKQAATAPPTDARPLSAYRAVEAARQLTPAGTIAVFDDADIWPVANRAWRAVAPGELLIATEGFGVAVATAAQLARPDRRVVCFADPAAIRLARDPLETVTTLALPVLMIILGDVPEPPARVRSFSAASGGGFAAVFEAALSTGASALVAIP